MKYFQYALNRRVTDMMDLISASTSSMRTRLPPAYSKTVITIPGKKRSSDGAQPMDSQLYLVQTDPLNPPVLERATNLLPDSIWRARLPYCITLPLGTSDHSPSIIFPLIVPRMTFDQLGVLGSSSPYHQTSVPSWRI